MLRGDPDLTRTLIDSIDRDWKFTAGVCSWGAEDKITSEQEIQVMNDFEAVAFAGMKPDQYDILWVRHSHAGHHELHFVIPRMELSTGKAFNAFPPGWEKDFAPLRDLENTRNEWTRPDDPARTRLFAPSNADIAEARLTRWGRNPDKAEKEKAREAINAYVKTLAALLDKTSGIAILERNGSRYVTAPSGSENGHTINGRPAIKLREK
ncbi:MAG: relaxase/mobilization nuclease domain-containing protein [Planctomycetota bacterium]|nr:relaxase/mobilization nuclease domain-containing protein [Planctomycetota bacterium]